MSSRIDEIRARWAAASPGPWVHDIDGHPAGWPVAHTGQDEHDRDHGVSTVPMPGSELSSADASVDAEAIAHAPEDVEWLLTQLADARDALGPAWLRGGTIADGIRLKTAVLERLGGSSCES